MNTPYIGVTGFVDCSDVDWVGRPCARMMPPGWRFMAGLLVSAKTVRGEPPTRRRYIPIERLAATADVLRSDGAWPVVHFNTRATGAALAEDLGRVMGLVPDIGGIQLNIVRPDVDVLRAFKETFPAVELIIQANKSSVGPDPSGFDILVYARQYADVASHVLLDLSGGVGKPLDAILARVVATAWDFADDLTGVSLGVAGGLDAETVGALKGMRVSCDSESRLRTPEDELDRGLALAYVREAVAAFAAGGTR